MEGRQAGMTPRPDVPLEVRFDRFCSRHPEVEAEIVHWARRAKVRGLKRWSVKAAVEYIRWHRYFERTDDEPWMINNSYTALYARRIEIMHPDLVGFFETRARTGEPKKVKGGCGR